MFDVAAAVELDGGMESYLAGNIIGLNCNTMRLQNFVRIDFICLVMLAVMRLHDCAEMSDSRA